MNNSPSEVKFNLNTLRVQQISVAVFCGETPESLENQQLSLININTTAEKTQRQLQQAQSRRGQ